jgi:hypothetical protein
VLRGSRQPIRVGAKNEVVASVRAFSWPELPTGKTVQAIDEIGEYADLGVTTVAM